MAVMFGCVASVRSLLLAGCDVNAQTATVEGRLTALHLAVERCRPDVVRAIVRHPGVDVMLRSADGLTAYDVAVQEGNGDICRLLRKRMRSAERKA
jgi:ankyrin repeat protein